MPGPASLRFGKIAKATWHEDLESHFEIEPEVCNGSQRQLGATIPSKVGELFPLDIGVIDCAQVPTVSGFFLRVSGGQQLVCGNKTAPEGDFFGTSDAQTLTLFDNMHELRCPDQRSVRAGVKPGIAAPHELNMQQAAIEISAVNIADLKFAARR